MLTVQPFWLPFPTLGKASKEMHVLAIDSGLEHTEVVKPGRHGHSADNICCARAVSSGLRIRTRTGIFHKQDCGQAGHSHINDVNTTSLPDRSVSS